MLEDIFGFHLDCWQNKLKWKRPIFIMTDTYMQLGHYQDDKLFSRCHGETAAQFFRQKCCCLRERSCCMLILYVEFVMLHMVYGKTHRGNERGFWPSGKWRSSRQQGYAQKVYLPLTLLSACYCLQESKDIALYGSNYHLWIWEMMLPSENAGSCIRQSVMTKCVGIRGHTLISCNKARSWVRSGPLFP